jgi:hypothetical protein
MNTTRKTLMIASAAAVLAFMTPISAAYAAEHHSSTASHSAGNHSHSMGSMQISHKDGNVHHAENDRGHQYGHRGHRGLGFTGINVYAGDGGCGYSYRRWQETGSRYWRSRYYDCIG